MGPGRRCTARSWRPSPPGWRVVRFEFAYMARMRETGRRQGPDRMPVLQEAFRQQVRLERGVSPQRPLFIGGMAMGGQVWAGGWPACWWSSWAGSPAATTASSPPGVRG
ncbi:alpha/beta family hydrolase [Synechococcus sp. CCY 9618]|uniref:alpha/beta family hydrolase n=1 Tax=Synechococcus sp. CCY 9618 TaxID=2815602 RepID=UPI00352CEB55